ncbi:MAG: ShlB/FhaC/HecB family hemolysin secretion/activation protein [Pseudomonadota bacterium]
MFQSNTKPAYTTTFGLLALLLIPFASLASAQTLSTTDSSQELIRQQERERVLREQQAAVPDVHLQPPVTAQESGYLPTTENPCFTINAITLDGDAAEQFQWSLVAAHKTLAGLPDNAIGRCIGTEGINQVMRRIQNAIVARGYVTSRVLAGAQDLKTGVLKLTLVPGRVGQIRYPDTLETADWYARPIREGSLLNLRDVEQALENLRRVPTVESDIQIAPAADANAKPGESDILIHWAKPSSYRLNASVDDAGTQATGKYQSSLTLSLDHWWALSDLFYLTVNKDLGGGESGDRGTQGYNVYYSIPFSYWLFAVTTSNNEYHQAVAGAFETYTYSGESLNTDISVARLMYRDAVRKTTLTLHGWSRASKNFINDTEVEVQRRRMAGWDLGVAHHEIMGNSTLDIALDYRKGSGALESIPAPEEAFGEGTSRPEIISTTVQLSLPITLSEQRFRYSGTLRAQQNNTPLVPQDRFSIGGRYSVRGFDGETTLLAERGWLIRNDLAWSILQTGQALYVGVDYGSVSGPSSKQLVGTRLSGAVLGIKGGYKSLSYDVFVGQPLQKPERFKTSSQVTGFTANWAF